MPTTRLHGSSRHFLPLATRSDEILIFIFVREQFYFYIIYLFNFHGLDFVHTPILDDIITQPVIDPPSIDNAIKPTHQLVAEIGNLDRRPRSRTNSTRHRRLWFIY